MIPQWRMADSQYLAARIANLAHVIDAVVHLAEPQPAGAMLVARSDIEALAILAPCVLGDVMSYLGARAALQAVEETS